MIYLESVNAAAGNPVDGIAVMSNIALPNRE